MIRSGRLEAALVVGIETFNAITALGFQGLQLLSPGNMKPFDAGRNGLVLGRGLCSAGTGPVARRPGSFFLRGGANLCDTHSMSVANPDGSTVALGDAPGAARRGTGATGHRRAEGAWHRGAAER